MAAAPQVDEGFEGGACLPSRHRRAIELAHMVVAAAHHRADLARGGINGDQGHLEPVARVVAAEPRQAALELVEPARHRILGEPLEREVERGADPGAVDGSPLELLADVVGEVGGYLPGPRPSEGAQRLPASSAASSVVSW